MLDAVKSYSVLQASVLILMAGCFYSSSDEVVSVEEIAEGTPDYLSGLNEKFDPIDKYFIPEKLGEFNCSLISEYFQEGNGELITELVPIDSISCETVFGSYRNKFGDFFSGYWLSYVNQIHNFYPITVVQYFGVVERPVVLVLFNKEGKVINSLVVADFYGEAGGCMSSKYLNDSTLVQTFEWNNIGKDTVETEHMVQHATIFSSGKIEIKEKN